jgi:glycosyltransferase involved in cell wall biosynthesis
VASLPAAIAPAIADATLDAALARATGPRVLIVTPDILGPIRNGGIGTAFAALAQTLAGAGRAVTILYTLGGHSEDGGDIARWTAHYAGLGIRFIPIWLERGQPLLDAPHHAWRAYRVYLWLKQHQGDYDLAYFPEWKGEAYYALQAKHVGLDFAALRLVVVTHSSTTWADSGNHHLPQQFDDLLLEFLERRCVELADALVSPSQYMLDWMRERGWRWSAPAHVLQNLMPEAPAAAVPADPAASGAADTAITEWVFFGRLERRKGLLVFLEALRQMPLAVREGVQITFLGKAIATPQFDSLATIRHRLGAWPRPLRLLTDYDRDQALAYLQQPGRVAVIASLVENSPYTVLECVLKRIPFIAADVGGIGELVHPEDRLRALFQPSPAALAASLLALEGKPYVPPRPAVPAVLTRERWLALQVSLLTEVPMVVPVPDEAPWPTISVCLVHYDRPALLAQALDSLRRQSYQHFNVVLVDDGSPSAAAQAYLESLGEEFARRGWKLVRQANAYLGAARNAAARHADGDYLLFMDDDNLAKPDELAVFAAVARRTGADILTTVSDVFADTDNAGSPPPASRQLWIPLGNAQGLGVFRNVFGDANALVRRRTFLELGGYTEDYGLGHEDWEFFAKASLAGADLQLVPEPLFWYRVNAASMLRAGDSAADHARSVRPYWAGLPHGIGPVLAYASYLQRRPARGPAPLPGGIPRPSSLWRKLSGPFHASDRARFRELLREGGWRATLGRGLRYIVRSRPRR